LFIILEMLGKYNTTLSQLAYPYTSKYFTPEKLILKQKRRMK